MMQGLFCHQLNDTLTYLDLRLNNLMDGTGISALAKALCARRTVVDTVDLRCNKIPEVLNFKVCMRLLMMWRSVADAWDQ
jgi:hypothetical protein